MSERASDELMSQLHGALAEEMTRWIKDGQLTTAQATCITKFLKDNDITGVAAEGSPLAGLAGLIPELTFDDVQRHI